MHFGSAVLPWALYFLRSGASGPKRPAGPLAGDRGGLGHYGAPPPLLRLGLAHYLGGPGLGLPLDGLARNLPGL